MVSAGLGNTRGQPTPHQISGRPQGLPLVGQTGTAMCWSPLLLPQGMVLLRLQAHSGICFKTPHPELSRRGTDVSCVSMGCGLQE